GSTNETKYAVVLSTWLIKDKTLLSVTSTTLIGKVNSVSSSLAWLCKDPSIVQVPDVDGIVKTTGKRNKPPSPLVTTSCGDVWLIIPISIMGFSDKCKSVS